MENYFHPEVSKKAVLDFFEANQALGNEIRCLQVYDREKLLVRVAAAPFSNKDKCEVYSLSKSFASTAIGLAVDAGLLTVEDRVVNLFEDKCPPAISENLAQMRVKHLLSMNTGHEACVMPKMYDDEDGIKTFLAQPVQHRPGSFFAYNTGASYMLSAIITRLTGESLLDYLAPRLFLPLGIEGVRWTACKSGLNMGGVGLQASCDDVAKLAFLYLNEGVWHGRRILSVDWVRQATSKQSDNSCNGTPDWSAGYGYQFWRNAAHGFRGDGAFGQLCYILPEQGLAFAVQAEVDEMQGELTLLEEMARQLRKNSQSDIEAEFEFGYLPLPYTGAGEKREPEFYRCDENCFGITWFAVKDSEHRVEIVFSDSEEMQTIVAGKGNWQRNVLECRYIKPVLTDIMRADNLQKVCFMACCDVRGNEVEMVWRHINTPHLETVKLTRNEQEARLDFMPKATRLQREEARSLTGRAVKLVK